MKNRVLGILLALVLLVTGTAMATEVNRVPSKTGEDTTTIDEVKAVDGKELPDEFRLIITSPTEPINAVLAELIHFVKEQKQPVVTYLPQNLQDAIRQTLSEGKNAENLVVYDCVPLIAVNYKEEYGDVLATISFATPYQENQTIFALVGFPSVGADGEIVTEWVLLPAQVNAESKVQAQFDVNTLIGLGQQVGIFMLLSEPLAE